MIKNFANAFFIILVIVIAAGVAGAYTAFTVKINEKIDAMERDAQQMRMRLEDRGDTESDTDAVAEKHLAEMAKEWAGSPNLPEEGFPENILGR